MIKTEKNYTLDELVKLMEYGSLYKGDKKRDDLIVRESVYYFAKGVTQTKLREYIKINKVSK